MAWWNWVIFGVMAFFHLLHRRLTQKRKLPPGPAGLPIIGHFHLLGKNPHRDLCRLARKHGPIMYIRLGMVPTIVVSSPAGAELFLKTNDTNFASRPLCQAAKHMAYDHRTIGFAPYGWHWRNMRKLCILELLSNFKISQFRGMRKAEVGRLVGSLKQAADGREIVDLSSRVLDLTRDMICLMVFGRKLVDVDGGGDMKGFRAASLGATELAGRFHLADYFPFLEVVDVDLQGLTRRMKDLSRVFDGFMEKIIDDHRSRSTESKGVKKADDDFVDTLMAILESGDAGYGFEFDRLHVKAVLLEMLLVGMDTSAVAVDWAMAELIRHPQVMKRLQKELEAAFGMEDGVDEESHGQLDKLEYLDMVVKETLRLHPIAPLLIPHESLEDCTVGGFHIPRKSRILVNAWAIGRDPSVWQGQGQGGDPEMFCPERFVGSDIDLRGRHFELIPFGSGRRSCPGLQLGLTLLKLVLAQLVHCFDWELPTPTSNAVDMSECFGLATSRAKPLMAIPKYRLTTD
ncbi:cytochrome P450 71AU50-like [Andrographis paniculata]|uniref:cytochrome P450 71AU50-like n=1 Tax=Andrographis paniculata TaxID=175694 RepID=UPI0021E9622A|nr:cytochrome P450 71AU50-like [Andrographis paniculata]